MDMESRIKLIFFDMEGTLFKRVIRTSKGNTAPSAWTLIAQHLGKDALREENATKDRWTRGGYTGYVEWMEDTIRIHQKYGLTRAFFDSVMNSIDYHPGVHETFEELRERGIRTALISGGFKAQADRAQRDLKIDHAFAACEYFWDGRGKITHWNLLPCDYDGKIDFMRLIMKEHGLKKRQCAGVFDGKNDIPLAREVGLSIAFNGDPELQKHCNYSINQRRGRENFRAILEYIYVK